LRSCNEF